MEILVDSSDKTLMWLSNIKSEIIKKILRVEYKEKKYWASFKSPEKDRNFVFFHPTKNQIRIFTRLPLEFDEELQPTPASQNWANMYPSIYTLREESKIQKAIDLIYKSYKYDLAIN